MKFVFIALAFCWMILSHEIAYAHNISGKVLNTEGAVLETATVALLDSNSKTLVKSTLTDTKGEFVFAGIENGKYYLSINMLGYAQYQGSEMIVAGEDVELPAIKLIATGNKLKEVTIRGQKPLIEVQADKLVMNVENSALNAGSSALDILSRSPGVNVDQNENISIKGRQGVNVMIDGKNMVMSGADLANMLKAMPSNSISKIEIISNPGAKYDAAGTAGIINIITKRDRNPGMNGAINASYGQGVYPKYSIGGSLNYRNKKLSAYLTYNYAKRWWFNRLNLDRKFYDPNSDLLQFSYVQDNFMRVPLDNHNGTFGLDYSIGKNTIVGIAGTAGATLIEQYAYNNSQALDGNNELLYDFITGGGREQDYMNYSGNLNFRHSFNDKGQKLDIDLDYARYMSNSLQELETSYFLPDGNVYLPTYFMRSDMDGVTQIRAIKADYTLPFENKATLEAGIKSTYVTSDNEPLFYEKTTGDFRLDTNRSNHFIYRENINAGYLNFNKKWDRWSTQVGLRAENTNIDAEQVTLDSTYVTSYTQLFPSFAVQRNLNEKHDLGVTLSRRIQRPNYEQLNPFKFFIDNTTYKEGYPYLRPALTYSAELSHTFKKRFNTSVSYSHTKDNITEVIQPSETEDSVTVQTNKNLTQVNTFTFSGTYPINITKWWNSTNNFTGWYSHFTGFVANTNLSNGSPAFSVYSNNNFTLPKGFRAELTFWYQSRQVYGFFDLKSMWTFGAGIQKNVLNDKGTIRLNAQDIFWTGPPRATSVYNAYREDFTVQRETRQVTISFTYRFGDKQLSPGRKRQSGAEDEKRRVGSQGG